MKPDTARQIGHVSKVQLQPGGLIVEGPGRAVYDATRRLEVDRLQVSRRGVECIGSGGERVLDIHHLDHPDKAYEDQDDLICVAFTSHYIAMRAEFGSHMVDGVAGENILVDHPWEIWPQSLSQNLGIVNQYTGEMSVFDLVDPTTPCVEFSRFCAQDENVATNRLGEILRFLSNGRRGFLYVLNAAHEKVAVQSGDPVFVLDS